MLGYLFEKTTALVSSTVDVVTATTQYIVDDIAAIPDAVSKGWDEGILPDDEPLEADVVTPAEVPESKRFGNAQ